MAVRERFQGRGTQFHIELIYGVLFVAGFLYLTVRVDPRVAAFMGGLVVGYLLRVWEKMAIYERVLAEAVSREAETKVADEVEQQVGQEVAEELSAELESRVPEEVAAEVEGQVADGLDERVDEEVETRLAAEVEAEVESQLEDRGGEAQDHDAD